MSWKKDDTFIRMREAYEEERESSNYLDDLKKLINGEATAAIQYKYASDSLVGENQSYLQSHFDEHFTEEWGHYTQLVQALMERGGEADMTIEALTSNALPKTVEIESFDTDYLREFFISAEKEAIKEYQRFYNTIEDKDPDLADIVSGIISDERGHKLDFERLVKGEVKETPKPEKDEEPEEDEEESEEEESEEEEEESEEETEEENKVVYKGFGNKFE